MTTPLVRGFETPATAGDQDTTWQLNITATSPIPGDPEVGVTFMAPPSGRVLMIVGGGGRDNTGNDRVVMRPELYLGTQPVPENLIDAGALDDLSIPGEADESIYGSHATVHSGLTPLEIHYARVVFFVSGGNTGDIFVREIIAAPLR